MRTATRLRSSGEPHSIFARHRRKQHSPPSPPRLKFGLDRTTPTPQRSTRPGSFGHHFTLLCSRVGWYYLRYLAAIEGEKAAFKRLIEAKATMLLPLAAATPPQPMQLDTSTGRSGGGGGGGGGSGGGRVDRAAATVAGMCMDTRTVAKGAVRLATETSSLTSSSSTSTPPEPAVARVIVDVREFRSSLPSMLHQRGLHLDAVSSYA